MLPIDHIERASQRLNPCLDMEADIVVVEETAGVSSAADWNQPSVTIGVGVGVSPEGVVSLVPNGSSLLFSQTSDASVKNHIEQIGGGGIAIDWFPDPGIFASQTEIVLESLELWLGISRTGAASFAGTVRFQFQAFDQSWNRFNIATAIDVESSQIHDNAPFTLDLSGQAIRVSPGSILTRTGPGRDSSGNLRTSSYQIDGTNTVATAKGFSLLITIPTGINPNSLWIGCADNAVVPNLNPSNFWRSATAGIPSDRSHGPYPPTLNAGYSPLDLSHNADPKCWTGGVPGFGATNPTNGWIGVSRPVVSALAIRAADTQLWAIPYHALSIQAYPASGTVTVPLDLTATPAQNVECKFDDFFAGSESITYNLHASSDNFVSSDITVGTVQDGDVIEPDGVHRIVNTADTVVIAGATFVQRYYKITATLFSSTGSTHYATPSIRALTLQSRQTFSTFRYLGDMQSTVSIDPVTGQCEIAQLKLPVYRLTEDARDLATQIATQFAPQNVEARIYAVDRVSKVRWHKDSFRLEQRDPSDDQEGFTFLAVNDRLTATVPINAEQGTGIGSYVVAGASVTGLGPCTVTVTVIGSPFIANTMKPTNAVSGSGQWRVVWNSGILGGQSFFILTSPANTSNTFSFITPTTSDGPSNGDAFEIHSDIFLRADVPYTAADFADVYTDVRDNQAQVPTRYRGNSPPATNRFTTASLVGKNSGTKASEVLAAIALHCGGVVYADRGTINFAEIFSDIIPSITWDERHYVTLETPTGMDRRMPVVQAGYNFDFSANTSGGQFANLAQFVDTNAFLGYGLANLYDIQVLPDLLCQWNDADEAQNLAAQMLGAFSTGVRLWKVKTVLAYPWLTIGDRVGIVTQQYTDRVVRIDSAGNDTGSPIAGRAFATGAIVGKDLWGQEFMLLIPGVTAISSSPAVGQLGGPFDVIPIPADFRLSSNVQGDPGAPVAWVTAQWTAPATPFFDHMEYSVQSRRSGDGDYGAVTTVVGTASGSDRIVASPGTDVSVTPITVSTAGKRFAGPTPFTIGIPQFVPPAPTITGMGGANNNTYTVTWDFNTRYVRWWSKLFTSATDPGTAMTVYNVGTEMPRIDNFTLTSGPAAVVLGQTVDATNNVELATFVAYDAHNLPSGFINLRTLRAVPVAPSAPTSAANTSVTRSSVTNHVVLPATITNFDFIRAYKNGVVLPPDATRTAAASGTQTITHAGLSPSEADSWQYSGLSSTGGESSKTTAFTTTTTGSTIPTPSISSIDYDVASRSFAITIAPGAGTPVGVTWHLKAGTANPPTAENAPSQTTSTSMSFRFTQGGTAVTVFFLIWGTLPGWTQSANSAIDSAICPASGGGF